MSGSWSLDRNIHTRVAFEILPASHSDQSERTILFFNDQRNFGVLTVCLDQALLEAKLATIGPSWLDNGVSLDVWMSLVRKQCSSKRGLNVPLVKFLMDQSKTAGIGGTMHVESTC